MRDWLILFSAKGDEFRKLFFVTRDLGRVVRKPVSANPGLKVNRSIHFSSKKMFFTAYVLCSLSLVKLKTEGRTV